MVINVTGALTQLLENKGYGDVLVGLRTLLERGQIEMTGSAMYHAFLPLLPDVEVVRQIRENERVNREYFGALYQPSGFFPPELAVNEKVLRICAELNYKWVTAAQVAYGPQVPSWDRLYKDQDTGLFVSFRNKRISTLLLGAVIRSADDLIQETQDLHKKDWFWFTVMDAETFGHHRVGHERVLFEILDNEFFEPVVFGDLLSGGLPVEAVEIRPSTWTNEEQDFWLDREMTQATTNRSFILWKDPENPIHRLQWQLTNFVIDKVREYGSQKKGGKWLTAREKLDMALASDQFWWASAKPWWSLEMIEAGAYELREVIWILYGQETGEGVKADSLYRLILDQAFEWQRSGYIRRKHLENSATFMGKPFKERTPAEWYNQIVLEFEDEMKKAVAIQDFEKAIKWRDALIKLRQGTDIYDVLHVVDELWTARNIPEVKPFFSHRWGEFSDFAKRFFRKFDSKDRFEQAQEHYEE